MASNSPECHSCGAALKVSGKFCPSCGTKVPPAPKNSVSLVTGQVFGWLNEEAEDLGEDLYRIVYEFGGEGRSQTLYISVFVDDEGDTDYDWVNLYSCFASIEEITLKEAAAATQYSPFGMKRIDDLYALSTSVRIESMAALEKLQDLALWLAIRTDGYEKEILGTDEY
jgi:hypothetical protein